MSTTPSSARAKRSRSSAGAAKSPTTPRSSAITPSVSAEQRHAMIAESAYRRAESRGFQGGDAMQDWLEGEKEVDALLSRAAH